MAKQSTDTPVLDLITSMTAESIEASDLEPRTLMMVRFAALVGVDAPPTSYLMNLAAAKDVDLDEKAARDVLTAIAPIVGTARIVSALGKIVRALGLAVELEDVEESPLD